MRRAFSGAGYDDIERLKRQFGDPLDKLLEQVYASFCCW